MKCTECRWYVPLRQLTKDEAKVVHSGVFIEVRGCCLGACRFERKGEDCEKQYSQEENRRG